MVPSRKILNILFSSVRRRKNKVLCAFTILCMLYYYLLSLGDFIFSRSFDEDFDYPLNIDIRPVVEEIISGKKPSVEPINYYPYRFLTNSGKCKTIEKLYLFIAVKSAMKNFAHRAAIRQTYGQENTIPGRIIKTLFFLGISTHPKDEIQRQIDSEMAKHKDIIQMDFHDHYFNNTIKTMMSFRWLYEHCSTADFYLFTDDDMYISVSNLIDYLDESVTKQTSYVISKDTYNIESVVKTIEGQFYAGYVYESRGPIRHKIRNKWRVSLEEYPWDKWPSFVPAGLYVISNKSMKYLYVGSLFVKHFRFDDIYLGIVAKKVGIRVTHCPNLYIRGKEYSKDGYKDVIASHDDWFQNLDKFLRAWYDQNHS